MALKFDKQAATNAGIAFGYMVAFLAVVGLGLGAMIGVQILLSWLIAPWVGWVVYVLIALAAMYLIFYYTEVNRPDKLNYNTTISNVTYDYTGQHGITPAEDTDGKNPRANSANYFGD